MALIVDTASSSRVLATEELRRWAEAHTAFISSEMQELRAERQALADALREIGMRVVMFEDLGGRDEEPERAYLDGVARADVYVGLVGDRYGRMLPSGRSPTHEEYREARARGKRISVWVAADGSERQGNARDLIEEVRVFHTTGSFTDPEDLARRVVERMAEIAADDESPWVKVGDALLRADAIRDEEPGSKSRPPFASTTSDAISRVCGLDSGRVSAYGSPRRTAQERRGSRKL